MSGWDSLTPAEQAAYGNGVGPWWFPAWLRGIITKLSLRFFHRADWAHHDYGYAHRSEPRRVCDLEFLRAMIADASALSTPYRIAEACVIAWAFWALCRLFGWASYGKSPV